jgi:WD40 repeat protein/class 3 adenylate cyclase
MPSSVTATFLFCDLVGSTALLSRIGDDANDEVRRRCFGVFRESVAEYRGTEVKTLGDGMLALFPNSVGDGIGCGVAMQRGIARLDRDSPLLGLGLRVGVAVGEAASEDNDWFGKPVVEAARLCGAATKGQILVADLARQLVGSRGAYRFTSLGAMELKGLDPTLVSEVAWEPEAGQSVVPLPTAFETRGHLPFVGRQQERLALDAAWRRAEAGHRGAVLLTGEQWAGKTRLVAEWARGIHDDGGTVLYGRCEEDAVEPYGPFAEALGWYAATAPDDALRAELGPLGGELARIIPALLNRFPDLPRPNGDAAGARRRLFDAVEGLLVATASAAPVLLVLDDLHATQPATLALLHDLLEQPSGARLLIVAIATDGAAGSPPLTELRELRGVDALALGGLTEGDVELLVASATGRAPSEVRSDAAALRTETDGNPGLIKQLLTEADGTGALPCPYKGLSAFQPEDHELFFGREETVANLLARLAKAPLLGVVGASGSGKSSLVRAGLLPALWQSALPGSGGWRSVVMAPGGRPLAELASHLAAVLHASPATLLRDLEADRRTLDLTARQLLVGANPSARLLLVVDQFEELFTICEDSQERERFVDALLAAVGAPGARTSAIVVLRADFYGHAASIPALAAALETNHVLLGPMREDELRAAVERPARHVGLRLEPGLADAVVADVLDQPGGLPLLSHALLETWKARTGRTLTLGAYRGVGGARGAIARSADAVLEEMDPQQRAIAARIFLRLVEVGEGTEDTSRRAELRELNPSGDPEVASVLQQLVDARLLTAGASTVEIAHEALIRSWPQLREWLDEDREGLRLLGHLRTSAHEWERLGEDPGELQRGARLAATLDWVDDAHPTLDDVERRYLDASRAAEEAELEAAHEQSRRDARSKRRLRGLLAAAAVLLVGVVLAGLLAVRQRNRADSAAHDALVQASRANAAADDANRQARRADAAARLAEARRLRAEALAVDDYDQALLLAVEGRHLDDSRDQQRNLLATIERSADAIAVIRSETDEFLDLGFTPDGTTLLASGIGFPPRISKYGVTTRKREASIASPGARSVSSAVSPDGRIAVMSESAGDHFELHLVDVATFKVIGAPLLAFEDALTRLSFSPDGRYLAGLPFNDQTGAGLAPAIAFVWDLAKGGEPIVQHPFSAENVRRDIVFLPDSKRILVAGTDGTAIVDIASGTQVGHIDGAHAPIAISRDGRTLAAALDRQGLTIGLFDLPFGQQRATLAGHREPIARLAFSPDGKTLASGADDRLVMVWDVASGERRAVYTGHATGVNALAFSPDGKTLWSGGADHAIFVWDLQRADTLVHQIPPGLAGVPALPFSSTDMIISPDGRYVDLPSADDGYFVIRDVGTGAMSRPSAVEDGFIDSFSPDSKRYVTIDDAGRLRVWDRETGAVLADSEGSGRVFANFPPGTKNLFTSDGRHLVALQEDDSGVESLVVLDATTLAPVGGNPVPIGSDARRVGVTPDGRAAVVVVAPRDHFETKVLLVDLETRRIVRSTPVEVLNDRETNPRNNTVAGDGRTVGLGALNGDVVVVDAVTGEVRPLLQAHDGFVESLTFAPGEATFVTTGIDGAVKLWDTATLDLLGSVLPLGPNHRVRASFLAADRLLIVYDTGEIFEWNPQPDAWQEHACKVAGRNLSKAEWADLFRDQPYRVTCPEFPSGE